MKIRIAVIHLGFALTGVVTTLLGPILPLLSSQWNLNDAQAGSLFTAQFVSAVAGSFVASRVLARWGTGWTVAIGMFSIAAGVSALGLGNPSLGVAGICLFGVGLGFALPATNLLIVELMPEQRVAALNILNFSWTVGAWSGPLMIASAQASIGLRKFSFVLAAAFVVISIFEFAVLPNAKGTMIGTRGAGRGARQTNPPTPTQAGNLPAEKRLVFAVLTCLFLMLYVGVENGFSGWLSVLTGRIHQGSPHTMAFVQSSFWGALLVGRLLAPAVVRLLQPGKLMIAGLAGAAAGVAGTIVSSGVVTLEMAVLLCGLGMAPLFPTAVAIFTEGYGTGAGGSIVLGLCGIGGATIPSLVGLVAAYSNSLRTGFMVTLCCVMFALLTFGRLQDLARSESRSA